MFNKSLAQNEKQAEKQKLAKLDLCSATAVQCRMHGDLHSMPIGVRNWDPHTFLLPTTQ